MTRMDTNELSNKCFIAVHKTFQINVDDDLLRQLRIQVSGLDNNDAIASKLVEFMWYRAGRPPRERWFYTKRVEYATSILGMFDELPACVRLAPPDGDAVPTEPGTPPV